MPNTQPNVLLICVDHWPGPLMSCMGHGRVLTPTLNQLARNGVLFTQAYSSTPTCIPARRGLMTGTTAQTHGDRTFREFEPMDPRLPTMPQVFRNSGYQAFAVGKLHVYPQRDRIGFDDVILNEEGRHHLGGGEDDFELFLKREGFAGQEQTHGMGVNEYHARPWHLPEHCHPTNWTVREMCRTIQRRDPTRPGFWYCSFIACHQPITPPRDYWDISKRQSQDKLSLGSRNLLILEGIGHMGVGRDADPARVRFPGIGPAAKLLHRVAYRGSFSRWRNQTSLETPETRSGSN